MPITSDFLVVGSGIAGLTFAIKAADIGTVTVLCKRKPTDSNTWNAQGGIAAVMSTDDSFEDHIQDTLRAGAGLCHEEVVRFVVEEGPARIKDLISWGMAFTEGENPAVEGQNPYALGLEGGHSKRRILHAGDFTGLEITRTLLARAEAHPNIRLYQDHLAVDLILSDKAQGSSERRALGAYVLNRKTQEVLTFLGRRGTILATGGAGKVYLYTSNPDVTTGDGIAMAYRAGAEIANMEFVQFHSTCLYHPQAKSFLISEALRGEGGILKRGDGTPFMELYHPKKELAPRDIVARAIDAELKKRGEPCVYLDIRHKGADFIRTRFPGIHAQCLKFGIDIVKEPIPVVPAAHYFCGGVRTDAWGATSISGLWAIGEVACTGLHGANRLASNSLLEGLVFAHRAFERMKSIPQAKEIHVPPWNPGQARNSDEQVIISQNWDEIRQLMGNYVGIVRSDKRLDRAWRRIQLLQGEIQEYYWDFLITSDLIELRNIATVAELVVQSARLRKESRGLHYTIDHPEAVDHPQDTVLTRPS